MKSIITIENKGKLETLTIEHAVPAYIISSILDMIAIQKNLTMAKIRKEFMYSVESAKIVEYSDKYDNQFHFDEQKREFVWL